MLGGSQPCGSPISLRGVKTLTLIFSVTLSVHYAGVDCQLKSERLWLLSAGANSQSYTHRPAYTVVVVGDSTTLTPGLGAGEFYNPQL